MPYVLELDRHVVASQVDHLLVGVLVEVDLCQRVDVVVVDAVAHGKAQFHLSALVGRYLQVFRPDAAVRAVHHQPGPLYLFVVVALPLRVGEGQRLLCPLREVLQFSDFRQQVRLSLEVDGVVDVEEGVGVLSRHHRARVMFAVSLRQRQRVAVLAVVAVDEDERLFLVLVHWKHHRCEVRFLPVDDDVPSRGERDVAVWEGFRHMFPCRRHGVFVILLRLGDVLSHPFDGRPVLLSSFLPDALDQGSRCRHLLLQFRVVLHFLLEVVALLLRHLVGPVRLYLLGAVPGGPDGPVKQEDS